jgi:hypothetical protein
VDERDADRPTAGPAGTSQPALHLVKIGLLQPGLAHEHRRGLGARLPAHAASDLYGRVAFKVGRFHRARPPGRPARRKKERFKAPELVDADRLLRPPHPLPPNGRWLEWAISHSGASDFAMGLTKREIATACVYISIVVVLIAAAFFGVQMLLPAQDKASLPEIRAPLEKVQAGPPRELPPVWEGKPEKPTYASPVIQPAAPSDLQEVLTDVPPVLPVRPVELPQATPSAPAAPVYVPPDIHRVQ